MTMKVAIRADASEMIGTGHVMRQVALAQFLLAQGVEVDLYASISDPPWLLSLVTEQFGDRWYKVQENDFRVALFAGRGYDALVIDSYALDQLSLQRLELQIPRVAVMIDGPWQDIEGNLGIAPVFSKKLPWLDVCRTNFGEFYCGPGYFMLRQEVIDLAGKSKHSAMGVVPRIVVSLGGTNFGSHTQKVIEVLQKIPGPLHVEIFAMNWRELSFSARSNGVTAKIRPAGDGFSQALASADLAITAAGTTVAEALFMNVSSILLPLVPNQSQNSSAIKELGLGTVVDPKSIFFESRLRSAIKKHFARELGRPDIPPARNNPIDEFGASRVLSIIRGSAGCFVTVEEN